VLSLSASAYLGQQYVGCYRNGDVHVMTRVHKQGNQTKDVAKLSYLPLTVEICRYSCRLGSMKTYFGLEVQLYVQ